MTSVPRPPISGVWRTDERARAAYAEAAGIYRIVPAAVAVPESGDELPALVRWAEEHEVALVPRGAGSAMGGGNLGDGVIVDLGRLRSPGVLVDAEARSARTGAAIALDELDRSARLQGLRLPPDPSSGRWATLGGMLSTNAAGPRSAKYGSVRRWVDALTLVTGGGEVLRLRRGAALGGDAKRADSARARFEAAVEPAIRSAAGLIADRWPRTRKNSAGYALDAWLATGDLLDLVIGAEGTLGFVTDIEWRLDPVPAYTAALRLTLPELDAVAPTVAALLPFAPSAIELLDRTYLDIAAAGLDASDRRLVAGAGALLLVELEGDETGELAASVADAAHAVGPHVTSVETALLPADAHRLWEIRHAASPTLARLPEDRRSLQVVEDACVPVEQIGEYIRAVREAGRRNEVDVVVFGHAGDGNVHVNLLPQIGVAGWERRVEHIYEETAAAVLRLGGTFTGEHGDGRLRAGLLERLYGSEIVGLFRAVKHSFDPHGIFNPGVLLPAGHHGPIARLKVGAGAAELPSDIAAGLRSIEQQRGYARPRLELADRVHIPHP
jgi:FAD/FMN-containing dehydrogenase